MVVDHTFLIQMMVAAQGVVQDEHFDLHLAAHYKVYYLLLHLDYFEYIYCLQPYQ